MIIEPWWLVHIGSITEDDIKVCFALHLDKYLDYIFQSLTDCN